MAFNQTLFRSPNRGGIMLSEYPSGDAPVLDQGADGLVWEEFDTNYEINPEVSPPDPANDADRRKLWSQYPTGDLSGQVTAYGTVSINSSGSYSGSNHIQVSVEPGGGVYFQFFCYDQSEFEWLYMKEVIVDLLSAIPSWTNNNYNRMAMYFKTASQIVSYNNDPTFSGKSNMYIGTYCRNTGSSRSSAESDNLHFYHYFSMPHTNGRWAKIVMDQHPTHQRGENGGVEQGNQPNPTGETGLNYFDTLTRFYITAGNVTDDGQNTVWSFDKFTLYNETRVENESNVYNMCGFYDPSNNRLYVNWNRDKGENDTLHEVRYSFQDIHSIGWDAATTAPNGTITPTGFQGYNAMWYDNNTISMGANTSIFVAVKPQNSNLFKQIQLDLT